MSAKAIREATGKDILNRFLVNGAGAAHCRFASVDETTKWDQLVISNPWLESTVFSIYCVIPVDKFLRISFFFPLTAIGRKTGPID